MTHSRAAAAGTPDTEFDELPHDPAAVAAALERAIDGRQALARRLEAAPDAPHAPALHEALRQSNARVERLLGQIAALVPPAADREPHAA